MEKLKIKLVSYKTKNITQKKITEICKLKMEHWKFSYPSQISWFKNNIYKNDIHNCLFYRKKLIGYTCLRKRKMNLGDKKNNYLLFDTLIIKKSMQKFKFGKVLMVFNNSIIKKNRLTSFLLTTRKTYDFYKKSNWLKCNYKFFFTNHKVKKNKILMVFNQKKIKRKKAVILLST